MRGKDNLTVEQVSSIGITPAHAGKSSTPVYALRRFWDHPRACGEKMASHAGYIIMMGSPPRMRGKGKQPLRKSV